MASDGVQPPLPPHPPAGPQSLQPAYVPPPPPPPHMTAQQQQQQLFTSGMPQISTLLMREAEAWRALLHLHGVTLEGVRQVVASTLTDPEATIRMDERQDATDQREAQYFASVTHLVSQCDALVGELMKVRGLRKAKRQFELEAQRELMRAHSDEVLAMGSGLASSGAMSMSALTAEVRLAGQALRAQITQARALLQAMQQARSSSLPQGTCVVVGLRHANAQSAPRLHSVDNVLRVVFQNDQSVTEEGVEAALLRLSQTVEPQQQPPVPQPQRPSVGRTFARRNPETSGAARTVDSDAMSSGSGRSVQGESSAVQ